MLSKATRALDRLSDYAKQPDGSWHADLRVPRLHVEGESPNDCKWRLLEAFDTLLAHWLESAQKLAHPPTIGSAESETDPGK